MTIDVHAYWDQKQMTLSELSQAMQQNSISRVVLSPPCTEHTEPDKSPFMYAVQRRLLRSNILRPIAEGISLSFYNRQGKLRPFWRLFTRRGKPLNKVLEPDNAGLMTAIAEYENMFAWYWVNPHNLPPEERILSDLQHPRVMGIKLHSYWHRFDAKAARPVFTLARRLKKPVYLILGFGWLKDIEKILREFTDVRVIFGYAGFPYFDETWKNILPFRNAMMDLTSFHIDQPGIADAIALLGADRCLFGTDCPYNFKGRNLKFDYELTVRRIRDCGLSQRDFEKVMSENAQMWLWSKN